jgi:hypothetical protein
MGAIDEQRNHGRPILAQLLALWDEHASRYNGVLYRAALVKNGEAWQSAVTLRCPGQKNETKNDAYRPTMATC